MNLKKFNLKRIKLNKTKTLILIGLITLLLFVGGSTYAYFAFSSAETTRGNMEIISNTVDNLLFNIEKEIYINANLANFGQGMSDLSGDTDATATLIPNNYDNTATAMYNIYLIIEANDLEYTTNDNTPELLLNVTDPNGKNLENITGLVHYDNGFDITTRTGGFLIASDYEITAQNIATIQTWNVEITLMNLDSNQNANMNKTFSAKLYLTQDKMSSYNPVQVTNMEVSPTYNSIDTTLNLSNGTADVEKYFFGIEEANNTQAYVNKNNGVVRLNNKILASADTVEYHESDTPDYEFTGLLENTEYIIYSYAEDINGVKSNVYETRVTTNEYKIPSVGEVKYSTTLNSITVNVNATSGDGTITKYMYSRNDGETWEESTNNYYTFNGLNDTTEYKIKIKVVDSNGRESTEYFKAISTETYILPVVSNVEYETTYNSITLTPTGDDGTNAIDHYEYSINNGAYQISNVFTNLNEQTEYTIRVKAVDVSGRETNPPYEIKVTTDTYKVPAITNVTTSSTTNSITINVSATNGDGGVTKYMYSRDSGSNWYESTSSSYTFSNLTSNTTFYVQVKVVDNNGRESAVSNTTIKTQYLNPVVNSVSASNITSNSVRLTVSTTAGSNSVTTYYYSNNNGSSYVSSTSNTYTFSGLSAGTTYNFRVYVVDSGGIKSNERTTSATTLKPTLADVCSNGQTLANCIKTFYNTYGDGMNGLYLHNGQGTNANASEEAGDNSYRYSGPDFILTDKAKNYTNIRDDLIKTYCAGELTTVNSGGCDIGDNTYSVDYDDTSYNTYGKALQKALTDGYIKNNIDNYVCFGSTATTCPSDNLYRIIGVFENQVKLIKADYALTSLLGTTQSGSAITASTNSAYGRYHGSLVDVSTYYWNGNRTSTDYRWSNSTLNTQALNVTYLNNLGSTWSNKISSHIWYTSNEGIIASYSAKDIYNEELLSSTINNKVGLMYASDYSYSFSPQYWTYRSMDYDDYHEYSWLFMGLNEWTINGCGTLIGLYNPSAIQITNSGSFSASLTMYSAGVRPTFYLNSSITYNRGTGTSTNPIRIN